MEITWFEWDDKNIGHIAKHSLSPDEVEDVAFDDAPWIRKGRDRTRYMLGFTAGGRYVFTVYVLKDKGIARVITAVDMNESTKKLYKRKAKQ